MAQYKIDAQDGGGPGPAQQAFPGARLVDGFGDDVLTEDAAAEELGEF